MDIFRLGNHMNRRQNSSRLPGSYEEALIDLELLYTTGPKKKLKLMKYRRVNVMFAGVSSRSRQFSVSVFRCFYSSMNQPAVDTAMLKSH